MKKSTAITLQIILGIVGSIVVGIIGLLFGMQIGVPPFGGVVGYEAGGVFFGFVGIVIGSYAITLLIMKILHKKIMHVSLFISAVVIFFLEYLVYDYSMPGILLLLFFVLPSVIMTAIAHPWISHGAVSLPEKD